MRFTTLFVLASAVVTVLCQSFVPQIEQSFVDIRNKVDTLVRDGIPFGFNDTIATYEQAIVLNGELQDLAATIQRSANLVREKPAPFNSVDSGDILSSARDLVPAISKGLEFVRSKKGALVKMLPIPIVVGIISPLKLATADLIAIQKAIIDLADILVSHVYEDDETLATDIAEKIKKSAADAVKYFQS